MISRKQKWRKSLILSDNYKINRQTVRSQKEAVENNSELDKSEEMMSFPDLSSLKRVISKDGNLQSKYTEQENLQEIKSEKNLRFSDKIRIILIPTVDEYIQASLADDLWYSKEEFMNFKNATFAEIVQYMKLNEGLSIKDATNCLYQNHDDTKMPEEKESFSTSENIPVDKEIQEEKISEISSPLHISSPNSSLILQSPTKTMEHTLHRIVQFAYDNVI